MTKLRSKALLFFILLPLYTIALCGGNDIGEAKYVAKLKDGKLSITDKANGSVFCSKKLQGDFNGYNIKYHDFNNDNVIRIS